jgi:protein phosphatase
VKAAGILSGAHQGRSNAGRDFEAAVGKEKNIAALQNGTVVGGLTGTDKLQSPSVSRCLRDALVYSETIVRMLEAFALSDPGKVRSSNQDYFRIVPELGLYLLADGMGGARGGERASQLAVEAVSEILGASAHRDAAALLGAVEEANQRVLAEAGRDPRLEGMGTTIVAALETRANDVAIASVGDSRAYMFEDGKLRAITEDQTWVQEVGRTLGLDEPSLKRHPMRHVLTMAVGVAPAIKIRYYAVEIKRSTLMLLSSDGLHGVITDQEIEAILKKNSDNLEESCRQLIGAANDAGGPDNVTVLLIRQGHR